MMMSLATALALAAAQPAAAAEPAQPPRALATGPLITPDDYPKTALRNREEGVVGFELTIGVNGRISACTIVRSSGSAALDSATCRLLVSRARFRPARDAEVKPVPASIRREMAWVLP